MAAADSPAEPTGQHAADADAPVVLIVDDDAANLQSVQKILQREGWPTLAVADGREALTALRRHRVAVLVTDLMMPGIDGLELLRAVQRTTPSTAVVVMTAYGTVETAVESMKAGAYDFVTKPLRRAELVRSVGRALERSRLHWENTALREELALAGQRRDIVGHSPIVRRAIDLLGQVAPARTTVLLQGESGTGKEVFARALHRLSGRSGPFVAVNCAAIPEALVESELFGHERGAFTGAVARTDGKFQQADTGTLLLDEVGELPPSMQAKLLRVLQESEVQRVGSAQSQRVDVRVVAATNRDLEAEVHAGRFRADLFYRLHVIAIELPPLRARGEDIPGLAMHFLRRFASQNGKPVTAIAPDAMAALQAWTWPGNVRELENAMERAVVLARTEIITLAELPERIARVDTEGPSRVLHIAVGTPLEEVERLLITETLRLTGGDKRRAAGLLGMAVRTLYRRLDEFGESSKEDDTSDETTEP
jgi:two-component system response regulator HydG